MSAVPIRSLEQVKKQMAVIHRHLDLPEARLSMKSATVSGWSLAEHLDHIMKVCASVLRVVSSPDAKALPRGITLPGRIVLLLGRIPRGRAQAPAHVVGMPASSRELREAAAQLEKTLDALGAAPSADCRTPVVLHPLFAGLNRPQAMRLVAVHTAHHLRIIDDILYARR